MCGIFGYISTQPLELNRLTQITSRLSHRGPDLSDHILFRDGRVGFGHQRLSIIDLSESAKQPMISQDGRYCIVYNGEVYNYQIIRSRILEEKKVSFKSTSDTEVILEAFILWGPEFIEMLNGIFSFAIYDIEEGTTWLFRDRIGVKPLFIYCAEDTLAFSSEIKALKGIPNVQLTINKRSIYEYLHLGYIPEGDTIWTQINKIPQGNYCKIDADRNVKTICYWNISEKINSEKHVDFATTKSTLTDLLSNAVEMQLISDVPVGVFLSGGIDSSLVAALACKNKLNQINTYSIGFEEAKFDESKYARDVAKYLGTHHTEFKVSQEDALELVEQLVEIYDEPFADSSAIPTYLVSKMAREHVTVVLSGDGGDEQFMGYGSYTWAKRMNDPLIYQSRWLIAKILENTGKDRNLRASKVFDLRGDYGMMSHIFSQEQNLFSQSELNKSLGIEGNFEPTMNETKRKLSASERQAMFDLSYYLPDDLLVKVDRASMANSIECRVPLLDHNVLEYSINIDESLKQKGNVSKYLLKQILFDFVPKSLFNRPKWGFSIPLNSWLQRELRFLVDELLEDSELYHQAIVEKYYVVKLIKDFRNGKDHLYNRIWSLIILNKWLKKNV